MMSSHDVPRTDAKKRIALILLGGVVGVAIGLAGVYGIGRLTGNAGADPACQASVETARRMAPLVRWVEAGQAPAAVELPVTSQTTGATLRALTVQPFNPLLPPPRNNGLNSNYRYIGRISAYRTGNELWCTQRGPALVCSQHRS